MRRQRRASRVMTLVSFIIGLSVVLSVNWAANPPGFSPEAPVFILIGVAIAAVLYVVARNARLGSGSAAPDRVACAGCGRRVPGDALLCPYCGTRIS